MTWNEIAENLRCSLRTIHNWKDSIRFIDVAKNIDSYPRKLLDALGRGEFDVTELPEEMCKLLDCYRELSLSWNDFAVKERVSVKWLRAWRKKFDYQELFSHIDDAQLDHVVGMMIKDHPRRGEVMMMSSLRVQEIKVTRQRLRESMDRVDPVGREERRRKAVKRRVYSVPGPHHLWHVDGYHKLRPYHLVIHAGVDGFTRLCTFIRCNDNNEADTVLQDFLCGVRTFGCPSRVRTDKGGENVEIGVFMVRHRGLDRGSIIMGRSIHNQRIERFWFDLKKEVISFYICVFSFLEREHGVDFTQEAHIFCIHYLFVPRINADLQQFQQRWNHHSISTEGNRTPMQLQFLNEHSNASSTVSFDVEDLENYGIENEEVDEEYYQNQDEMHGRPRICSVACPLNQIGFQYFSMVVRPLSLDNNDTSLYIEHVLFALEQFDIARML